MVGAVNTILPHFPHIKLVKVLKQSQIMKNYEDYALDTKETPFSNHIYELMQLCNINPLLKYKQLMRPALRPHISRSVTKIHPYI